MHNDIWSLIQRLLSFEEPVAKWLHFKNSIAKLEKIAAPPLDNEQAVPDWADSLRERLRESFDLSDQECDFGCKFATAFAEQESSRFTSIALKMWRHKFPQEVSIDKATAGSNDDSRLRWKEAFTKLGPIFAVTLKDGPWQEDARGRFVRDSLKQIKASSNGGPDSSTIRLGEQRRASKKLPASCLPNSIVLVEGATEAVLLPLLGDCLQFDLQQEAVLVVPAGGANQVVKKYLYEKEIYSLPIFVILDLDAEEQSDILTGSLRDVDRLHILSDGEIEDVLRVETLVPMLNRYIASLPGIVNDSLPVKREHFSVGVPRKKILARLWRERGLGKFDKVGFAKFVAEDLPEQGAGRRALSDDGLAMIESLKEQSQRGALQQSPLH